MVGERENRASHPDTHGQEPKLPDAEVGEHAHRLIEDFKHALISTPEFLLALGDKFFTQQSRDEDNRFRRATFIKGDAHYWVRYEEIYNEKNGRGREKLWLLRESHNERLAEDISVCSETTNNGNQFEKGYINKSRSRINSDVFWNTHIGVNIPWNTQSAIQAVQDFLTTHFGEPQPQPSTRNPQAGSTPSEGVYKPPVVGYDPNRSRANNLVIEVKLEDQSSTEK